MMSYRRKGQTEGGLSEDCQRARRVAARIDVLRLHPLPYLLDTPLSDVGGLGVVLLCYISYRYSHSLLII